MYLESISNCKNKINIRGIHLPVTKQVIIIFLHITVLALHVAMLIVSGALPDIKFDFSGCIVLCVYHWQKAIILVIG